MWISMLMSLAVVFFGMQLMMVGPLKGRLDSINARLDNSDDNMKQLVGAKVGVSNTQSMLNSLTEMEGQLDRLAALRNTIDSEANATANALASLEQIASVQHRIIAAKQQTADAATQIASLESLRDQVLSGADSLRLPTTLWTASWLCRSESSRLATVTKLPAPASLTWPT